jgi:hypothetical protein
MLQRSKSHAANFRRSIILAQRNIKGVKYFIVRYGRAAMPGG